MKKTLILLTLTLLFSACKSQPENKVAQIVGGPCQGCEAIFEFGDKNLSQIDTLPDFLNTEPKLRITGTVYQKDSKTPANNVVVYVYHTNRNGIYESKEGATGWAERHGYIRGWIRTSKDGKYEFYTFRPAAYPNGREAEHIHVTVKEPDRNEYYLDAYYFDDDPLLTDSNRANLKNRGGSGITMPILKNGILSVERDLILGLNIPDYD